MPASPLSAALAGSASGLTDIPTVARGLTQPDVGLWDAGQANISKTAIDRVFLDESLPADGSDAALLLGRSANFYLEPGGTLNVSV